VYKRSFLLSILLAVLCGPVHGQKVAVLSPTGDVNSSAFAHALADSLSKELRVLDGDLATTAYRSSRPDTPYNLTLEQAKQIGSVIGCDFFVLVDSTVQRRARIERPDYFEAYAAVFTVSSRTGRLVRWDLKSVESENEKPAADSLLKQVPELAKSITSAVHQAATAEVREAPVPQIEEVPADGSTAARDFRPPVPYRRLKPEYTSEAYLHSVTATVDVSVDLDAQGNILRTEATRWAGYGLDEAVIKAVTAMNWRPAERNGKALPIRFLLRYNFKKVEKE
jgi:TonB family protein